jgi:transposase InsO family protein
MSQAAGQVRYFRRTPSLCRSTQGSRVKSSYIQSVVDTYGSVSFGFLHTAKQPEAAVALLHNDVLPFYRARSIPVTAILTGNGRELCCRAMHPYELYLSLNELEHRQTRVRHPYTKGFVERFQRTVLDEFFRSAFRTKFYESVEAWQTDLDTWLDYYTTTESVPIKGALRN